jgi:hypothetical protein
MAIEKIDKGRRVVLTPDAEYDDTYTLDALYNFTLESQVAGVTPDSALWFDRANDTGEIIRLWFPTEGDESFAPEKKHSSFVTLIQAHPRFAVLWIVGIFLLGFLFGLAL